MRGLAGIMAAFSANREIQTDAPAINFAGKMWSRGPIEAPQLLQSLSPPRTPRSLVVGQTKICLFWLRPEPRFCGFRGVLATCAQGAQILTNPIMERSPYGDRRDNMNKFKILRDRRDNMGSFPREV